MNKKDILEIKRRFTKEGATFSKLAGCYVNSNKEKILTFRDTFLNITDDELFKYLEIAKKSMSGKLMNNLLDLEFAADAEEEGGSQSLLLRLRDCRLEDDELLDEFYEKVISSYDKIDNYLILLFHDAYDVPMKTSDNLALDDSEEVYEYIICAICPVDLSKQVLGYDHDDNKFEALERDWVVGTCESAFTFPAFSERSTDLHHALVYTKDVKNPHTELWNDVLNLKSEYTSFQKRSAFTNLVTETLGADEEENMDTMLEVQKNLSDFITLETERRGDEEPLVMNKDDVASVLEDAGFAEEQATLISDRFEDFFEEKLPLADELVDDKLMKNGELKLEKKELQRKVVEMTREMEEAGLRTPDTELPPILVRIPEEKQARINTTFIDGERVLVIPIDDIDTAVINGKKIEID
jgi:hypothetical protein